ncbi:MAG TPA: NADPH-dependent FMN reductase [Myxococcota bacterium]|nr:NADPH-dependent FMN reductase [Myxococcota bacterium]
MAQYNIAILIGSLRKDSFNRKLAQALVKMASPDLVFKESKIADLPLYNQDNDQNQAEPVKRLKAEVLASDGVLFVTPEYNRSVPGVLKNAIDNASRPFGQSAWAKKPAGMIGVSPGAMGTALAQQHLRNVLAYLDMPTLCHPEAYIQVKEGLFDDQGGIGEASRKFIQNYLDNFAAWIRKQNSK